MKRLTGIFAMMMVSASLLLMSGCCATCLIGPVIAAIAALFGISLYGDGATPN
ncbi:MAG: hypothetical protein GXY33_21950 [Phycisphaerae bacterium]|nr:hypothetical protein [Phycisphaerae bacterium]